MVETTRHRIETKGQGDVQDLTPLVSRVLDGSSMKAGLATVAVVGSTAGMTTIEFEPGAVADLNRVWEQLAGRVADAAILRRRPSAKMPLIQQFATHKHNEGSNRSKL